MLRVTVVGTSLSTAERYTWPDLAGRDLCERVGKPVKVTRVAMGGATSAWAVSHADQIVSTRPDIVLVELSVNDADIRRCTTVKSSVAHHEDLLRLLKAERRNATILLLTMNPASGPRAWTRPFLSRYYATYVSLARQFDTGLVDIYARWLVRPADERQFPDGLHPVDGDASKVIVAPVVDAMARTLRAAPS